MAKEIVVKNLSLGLRGFTSNLLEEISFEIDAGGILGLLGESGCGKSLTASALMGLLPTEIELRSGTLDFFGERFDLCQPEATARLRGCEMAMVFQDALSALNPLMRIRDQLEECLLLHEKSSSAAARRQRSLEILERMQLKDPERVYHAYPHQLSGGMRQRVLLAMALIHQPRFLIVDEVTTALDLKIQKEILDLLLQIHEAEALSILFITHDLRVARYLCEDLIILYAGELVERAPAAQWMQEPCHMYSKMLLRSVPTLEKRSSYLERIRGRVPSMGQIEAEGRRQHCIFAGRCSREFELCHQQKPTLMTLEPGHEAACFRAHELWREARHADAEDHS
ncbi:MAG: ABC transporter ATP-binding protein [Eubacteriales bacterium]|nr:ABC transporter ATP-binding protein [Eubacteriales bacterium]